MHHPSTYYELLAIRSKTVLQIKWAQYAIYKTPMLRYKNNYELARLQVNKLQELKDKLKAIDFTIHTYLQGQRTICTGTADILQQIGLDSYHVPGDDRVYIQFFTPQQQ